MGDACKRIAHQAQAGKHLIVRLPGMPVHQTGHVPIMGKEPGTERRARNVIDKSYSEQVPRVVVSVAVIALDVMGIVGKHSAVLAYLIEGVRPGVAEG